MSSLLKSYIDFSGGLTEVAPDNMQDNELAVAKNAVPGERGGISKAKGTAKVNQADLFSGAGVDYLVEFGKSDGTIIKLAWSGTKMKKWDGTSIKTDLPGPPQDHDIFNDKLYWLDGTKFWVYDGSTVAEVTMNASGDATTWNIIKTCNFIEQRGKRHFYAKKNSNTIYFSEAGDPTYIKAANSIKAVTDDSMRITALKEYAGALLVGKKNAWFAWTGNDPTTDVQFNKLSAHVGPVNNNAICNMDSYLVYLADDDVYALTSPYPAMITPVNLSKDKISNIIRAAGAYKEVSSMVYYQGWVRMTMQVKTAGSADSFEEYRMQISKNSDGSNLPSWYGPFTHQAEMFCVTSDSLLYSGHPTSGFIYQHDTGDNYDGVAIPFHVESKPFDVSGDFAREHKFKKTFLAAAQYDTESSTTDLQIKVDYRVVDYEYTVSYDESLIWSEGIWSNAMWGWNDFVLKEIKLSSCKGHRIQIKLTNEEVGQPLTLYGVAFEFKPRKVRGTKIGVTGGTISA